MQDLQKIIKILTTSEEISIITHTNPDGDAIGSQIALGLGLEQLGIKTYLYNKDKIPENFAFLTIYKEIKAIKNQEQILQNVVYLDCATQERTGYNLKNIRNSINIDHHVSNDYFGDYNLVRPKAAATCEIIYDILNLLKVNITPEIATALYTGISTDTGSFVYDNTSPNTHKVAAALINNGAEKELIRMNIYENINREKLTLTKIALNKLSFFCSGKIALVVLNLDDYKNANASFSDGDGIVSTIKNIAGVEVALVFKEIEEKKYKVSMRSKKFLDVNEIAALFGGGGHAKAAGCTIEGDEKLSIKKVIKACMEKL